MMDWISVKDRSGLLAGLYPRGAALPGELRGWDCVCVLCERK